MTNKKALNVLAALRELSARLVYSTGLIYSCSRIMSWYGNALGWMNDLHLCRVSSEASGQSASPSQSQLSDTQVTWSSHRNSPTSHTTASDQHEKVERTDVL